MALVGRVTILWILVSFVILFIVLKMDGTLNWSWLVVFVPMWLLDISTIAYLTIFLVLEYRQRESPSLMDVFNVSGQRKRCLILIYLLQIVFMLLLSLNLDGYLDISYVFVFIPLWIIFTMLAVDCSVITWREAKHRSE